MSQLQRPLSAVDQALVHMANRANKRKPPLDERLRLAQQNLAASQAGRDATSVAEGAFLANKARQEAGGGGGGLGSRTGLGAAVGAVAGAALGQPTGGAPPDRDIRFGQVPPAPITDPRSNQLLPPDAKPISQRGGGQSRGRGSRLLEAGVQGAIDIGTTGIARGKSDLKKIRELIEQGRIGREVAGTMLGREDPRATIARIAGQNGEAPVAPDAGLALGGLSDQRSDEDIILANRARGRAGQEAGFAAQGTQALVGRRARTADLERTLGGGTGLLPGVGSRAEAIRGGSPVTAADFQNPQINRFLQSPEGRAALAAGRGARAPVQSNVQNDPQLAARVSAAQAQLDASPKAEPRRLNAAERRERETRRVERREKKVAHRADVKQQLRARSLGRRARAETLKSERLERNRIKRDAKALKIEPGELFAIEQQGRQRDQMIQQRVAERATEAGLKLTKGHLGVIEELVKAGVPVEQWAPILAVAGVPVPGSAAQPGRPERQPKPEDDGLKDGGGPRGRAAFRAAWDRFFSGFHRVGP